MASFEPMRRKEEILSDMLKDAAKFWGYQESEMESGFDPLVQLLMGACAKEFEKVGQEIASSRERILNRLIETLIPDVHVNPLPAHAIAHARTIEAPYYLRYTDQIYTHKMDDLGDREIYFSPANSYRIVDGDIRYMAIGKKMYDVYEIPSRDEIISETTSKGVERATMWLGIDLHHQMDDLSDLQFFFEWTNEPEKDRCLSLLAAAEWYFEGKQLQVKRAYATKAPNTNEELSSPFEKEYNPTERRIREVEQFYANQFIKIVDWEDSSPHQSLHDRKKLYPSELEDAFTIEELSSIQESTIWIKVVLPNFFPVAALQKTQCYINCFPVMNRRLHRPANIRVNKHLNHIPLKDCTPFFFDVEKVQNLKEIQYHEIPLSNIRRFQAGKYTLRRRGVGRFDSQAASHKLFELIDLLRDESTAFQAYDLSVLRATIRELTQSITNLEQRVLENTNLTETTHYVVVQPLDFGESISIEYWSTNGEDGNHIQSGAILDMYQMTKFQRDTIKLVTPSRGGRNELSSSEKTYSYKRALISRERIVTREDIKAYCWSKLGGKIKAVEVKKGFLIGDNPKQGIIRTQEAIITPLRDDPDFLKELHLLKEELLVELNNRSATVLPIVVKVA